MGLQKVTVVATDLAGNQTTGVKTWNTAKWLEVGIDGVQASVVFDDRGPELGDEDYNEGVIDMNIAEIYNGKNETKATLDLKPIASGTCGYFADPTMSLNVQLGEHAIGSARANSKPLDEGITSAEKMKPIYHKLDGTEISSQLLPFDNVLLLIDLQEVFDDPLNNSSRWFVNLKPDQPFYARTLKFDLK